MEKKKLTLEKLDRLDPSASMVDNGFSFIQDHLSYSVLEDAASELIDNVLVLDPLGIVYEHYSFTREWCYIVLKYFTDIDVDGLDKDDLFAWFGQMCDKEQYDNYNIQMLHDVYYRMKNIVEMRYKREHSFDYKMSVFIDNISQQSADGSMEMSDRLLNLIGKVKEADAQTSAPNLTLFARKDD